MEHKQDGRAGQQERADRMSTRRGIAILGVVAIHTSAHFAYVEGTSVVVQSNIVVDIVAHYAVPLFVLLSGLALTLRYGADGTTLARENSTRDG
jgi:surface polysaccharide O-acyltransferase-like enzyme